MVGYARLGQLTWIALLAVATGACTTSGGRGPSDDPALASPEPTSSGGHAPTAPGAIPSGLRPVTPAPVSSGSGSLTFPPAIVEPILVDAAARAGVPVTEVTVISAEPRTWPDAGLGCPLPGMAYPQVLVDGYQVVVRVGQQTFDYRGSAAGRFRLCTNPG